MGSTASGYNSSEYDNALFTLTKVHPNYAGVGIVTYSMAEFLQKNVEFPGIFNAVKSNATLVPERYFLNLILNYNLLTLESVMIFNQLINQELL